MLNVSIEKKEHERKTEHSMDKAQNWTTEYALHTCIYDDVQGAACARSKSNQKEKCTQICAASLNNGNFPKSK